MTKWEIRLWNDLKNKKMPGFKVRRQYGLDDYVVDFYCMELKLAIEVDGAVHYFKKKMKKNRMKDNSLKKEDIRIIRIKTTDLKDDYESMIIYLEDIFRNRAQELGIDCEFYLEFQPPLHPSLRRRGH